MEGGFYNIQVPPEFEREAEILVEALRRAGAEHGDFDKDDAALLRPDARYIDAGIVIPAVLSVASAVAAWITKPWFDKYVAPVILEKLERPGKAFEAWLRKKLGVKQ